ncbi:phytase [Alteromonas gracilis]|uniref:phytase n=1 Tax=Alteromonas gracilis TaxID=1479524 RepID=UPI0030CA8B1C
MFHHSHIRLFIIALAATLILSMTAPATRASDATNTKVATRNTALGVNTLPLKELPDGFTHTLHFTDGNGMLHTVTMTLNTPDGIVLKNTQGRGALIKGSYSLATPSIRHLESDVILDVPLFDKDTQKLVVKRFSASSLLTLPDSEIAVRVKGSETLCAGVIDGDFQLINIDATGMLNQYSVMQNSLVSRRQFAFGAGAKSCAISSQNRLIYVADEYAGIWQIDADSESEVSRELIYHNANIAVEGISVVTTAPLASYEGKATSSELLAWVSPDTNTLWLKAHCSEKAWALLLENTLRQSQIAPETVILSLRQDAENLLVQVDDDNSNSVYSTTLPVRALPLKCDSTKGRLDNKDIVSVTAIAETQPVEHYGDAADDPAIWVNDLAPSDSIVIGTDKKGALNSYRLDGNLLQTLPQGRVNNVDVGYNVNVIPVADTRFDGQTIDIAVASNRTHNSLSITHIDKTGTLTYLGDIATSLNDVYGMCLFVEGGRAQVIVNDTSGHFERYAVAIASDGAVSGSLLQQFSLPSQPEGCVVDTSLHIAYLGEEAAGIWQLPISDNNSLPIFSTPIQSPVEADIEGLALFDVDEKRYVIASSQGNNTYAIYQTIAASGRERPITLTYVGSIDIAQNDIAMIDGVSETDGLDATNANLGGVFKEGLWVVQDGRNVLPTERQNFKLVSGSHLADAIRTLTKQTSKH